MSESVSMSNMILEELQFVKTKVFAIDKELHRLREDFEDTHMNASEKKLFSEALEAEKRGKTISLSEAKKKLGL